MAFCSKCGTPLDDRAKFCPNCGEPVFPRKTDKKEVSRVGNQVEGVGSDRLDVEEGYNPWKEYRIHIVGCVLVALLLGGCWWYYKTSMDRVENDKAIQQESQRLALQREKEKLDSIENAQKEELLFVENFYKELEEYSDYEIMASYIRKNVTDKALKTLKDEFGYDCEDGECLATWLFSYEAGTDLDSLYDRKIEPVSKNTFLVTSTWGYSDGSYSPSNYRVRLGIVKDKSSYKINTIKVERNNNPTSTSNDNNSYSKYVGKWTMRRTTDDGQKMLIEVTLKENHSGEVVGFHDRGNVADVLFYEEYQQCILVDGILYMTKDGDINGRGVPKFRSASDGLYSYDNIKFTRESK